VYDDPAYDDAAFDDPVLEGTSPLYAVAEQFGRRLAELAFEPGLVAAVDQHSAAVRDAVHGRGPLREALIDYVLGFTDALRELGWHAHEGYDFAALRLTAVCHFMRAYGVNPA
jgi:hypothetical protein